MTIDFREALAEELATAYIERDFLHGNDERARRMARDDADVIMTGLPDSIREAVYLGMAWAEVEAELPDPGYAVQLRGSNAWYGEPPRYFASALHHDGRRKPFVAKGPTPTAALRALAAQLQEAKR